MNTGEFAAFCGVDKKTLFHYDAIGLLKPAAVRENGYREYRPEQIHDMDMIKIFQASGYTLAEIREMLLSAPAQRPELMRQAQERIAAQLKSLTEMQSYLQGKQDFLVEYRSMPPDGCRIETRSLSFDLKDVDTLENHFFSFLRDRLYTSFLLEPGEKIRLCRFTEDGSYHIQGTAIRFFLQTASYDPCLEAHIQEKLTGFRFSGRYPWFVENLPHFLLEDPESTLLRVTVFRGE